MNTDRELLEAAAKAAWVCPWGICDPAQARVCRAEMRPRKGCGGMFPNMSAEQARRYALGDLSAAAMAGEGVAMPTDDEIR